MVSVGVHVSVAGGVDLAVSRACEKGCDAFQIFSSNPRGWKAKPIPEDISDRFVAAFKRSGLSLVVDHMPYLPNLASANLQVYSRSVEALTRELERCHILGIPFLVTHLGSHLGAGWESGRERIVMAIETAFSQSEGDAILLLENSSGTKNSMGSTFSDLAAILRMLPDWKKRIGICLDTCHLHAAGYDLRTVPALQETIGQFQESIGLERLRLVHLNDCRGPLGSHLDRHEHIGLGQIGEEGFRAILSHPALKDLSMILETPVDSRRNDIGNLAVARNLAQG